MRIVFYNRQYWHNTMPYWERNRVTIESRLVTDEWVSRLDHTSRRVVVVCLGGGSCCCCCGYRHDDDHPLSATRILPNDHPLPYRASSSSFGAWSWKYVVVWVKIVIYCSKMGNMLLYDS